MKIEIDEDNKGRPYFRIVAGNGALMLESKPYARRRNLDRAVRSLRAGLPDAPVVELA